MIITVSSGRSGGNHREDRWENVRQKEKN